MPKVRGRYDAAGVLTFHDGEGTDILDIQPDGDVDVKVASKLKIVGTAVDATALEINRAADVSARLVAAGATLAVTVAAHEGRTILLDTLAGSVCTLPAASGSGARFRFVVSIVPTSNSHIVKVANASDVMAGFALVAQDAADTAVMFETAAASDTVTLNRTTTGGTQKGETIEVEDIATNVWAVMCRLAATGTEATPFSATV